ncbi:hypothetical protein ILUMI_13411 [Ignelater luminosus]|uniref:Uncharacterized protein n=1 Tax=Ignelater luminosus TaxID=2038154 RepID=A0A8K0CYM2_IGNLU|nr:hypothetical protein ILUMI_13411 [Ignelater luminosus]
MIALKGDKKEDLYSQVVRNFNEKKNENSRLRAREISRALKKKVEEELQILEEQGVISKVVESDWASPLVVIPKADGSVRAQARWYQNNRPSWRLGIIIVKFGKLHYLVCLDGNSFTLKRHIDQLRYTRAYQNERIRETVAETPPAICEVGVDYAGPFSVTLGKSRGIKSQKTYVCIFICLATKTIHLELASNLSSEAFLAAFCRFVSRRGRCNDIHSDCGTNVIGAYRQLTDIMREAVESEK